MLAYAGLWGLGFRVQGFWGFGFRALGFRAFGHGSFGVLGFKGFGSRFGAVGFRLRVQGFGVLLGSRAAVGFVAYVFKGSGSG